MTPDWPTCHVEPCTGIRVGEFDACLAHLSVEQLDMFLGGLERGSDIDVRGTTFTTHLLSRLVGAGGFGTVRFDHAHFLEETYLGLFASESACFDGAVFDGTVSLSFVDAQVLTFARARFTQGARFRTRSGTRLDLDGARFTGPVMIGGDADLFSCQSTRFDSGLNLRLTGASVSVIQTTFGAASSMASDGPAPVRLLALDATDVSNLELIDIDLRDCTFADAHRLDQLRIAGRCVFDTPPTSWRWTRRQTIADEHMWRGWWYGRGSVGPERVAALYRSLRKAMEDSKNEAGAGDFYYGEMDARRHSKETRRTERLILWFYWLLSGYGQRAGRALIALLVLIATVAILLTVWGQPPEISARIAVGAVVFRDDRTELTAAGEWTVLAARFLGPVLLALAVLAVRARVKR